MISLNHSGQVTKVITDAQLVQVNRDHSTMMGLMIKTVQDQTAEQPPVYLSLGIRIFQIGVKIFLGYLVHKFNKVRIQSLSPVTICLHRFKYNLSEPPFLIEKRMVAVGEFPQFCKPLEPVEVSKVDMVAEGFDRTEIPLEFLIPLIRRQILNNRIHLGIGLAIVLSQYFQRPDFHTTLLFGGFISSFHLMALQATG